ncbi:ankyrin repeat protein [Histomonas meleagridis]|uniref:ankyrin repeat protein n=1 Tax=Histomonas meleagridis TaxID=135588 RepID=UPI0035593D96|nr:ankyrin repeat protein [Histomonas meleagridis]KAH0806284.1 ankyrin repeat protein [Histomonas meleagridis]
MSFSPKNLVTSNSFVLPPVQFPTPLIYAICCRQDKIVRFLVNNGALLTEPINSWFPIHYAVASRDTKVIEAILSNKSNDEKIEELKRKTLNDGATAIHIAVASGQPDLVSFIIHQGANVNSTNNENRTPLHLSMGFFNDIIARMLVAAGADISCKDDNGMTPQDIAQSRHNNELESLMGAFADGSETIPDLTEVEYEVAQNDISKISHRSTNRTRTLQLADISNTKAEEIDSRLQNIEERIDGIYQRLHPGS